MSKTGYIPLKTRENVYKTAPKARFFLDFGPEPKKPPLVFRDLKTRGAFSVFGRRPNFFEGFCMVLLRKALQKRSQNTIFALENHVWEDSVSIFSRLRRLQWLEELLSILMYIIDCDLVWYCLCFQRSLYILYALLLVKSAAGAKFLVLFAGFRS